MTRILAPVGLELILVLGGFVLARGWLALHAGCDRRRLLRAAIVLFALAPAVRAAAYLASPDRDSLQEVVAWCRLDAIAAGGALAILSDWRGLAMLRQVLIGVVLAAASIALATQLDRSTPFGCVLGSSVLAVGLAALGGVYAVYVIEWRRRQSSSTSSVHSRWR